MGDMIDRAIETWSLAEWLLLVAVIVCVIGAIILPASIAADIVAGPKALHRTRAALTTEKPHDRA